MDIHKQDSIFEKEKSRVKESGILEKDKDRLFEFLQHMESSGIGKAQLIKYIISLRKFFSAYRKPLDSIDSDDLEKFLMSMQKLKPTTHKIRWYSLKKFFDYIGKGDLFKGFNIKFERCRNKLPEEIITEEEVNRIVDSASSFRNSIFIAILYESGTTISELLSMKVGDLQFDDKGCIIVVNSKTRTRAIRIMKYSDLLKEWVKTRTRAEPLFNIKYGSVRKILRCTMKQAGIEKRIHAHLFRDSRATHLSKFLTESQMEQFFGWTQGSEKPKIYILLSGKDIDNALVKSNESSNMKKEKIKV